MNCSVVIQRGKVYVKIVSAALFDFSLPQIYAKQYHTVDKEHYNIVMMRREDEED